MSSRSAPQRPLALPCTCSGHSGEQPSRGPPACAPPGPQPPLSTGTGVLMALPLPTLRLWAVSCLGTVAVTEAPASGREQPLPARGPSASPRPSSRKVKLLCPAGSHRMVAPPSCPAFVSPSSSVALGAPGVRVRLAQPLTSCFLCGHLSPHLPLGTRLQLTGHLIRRRARCPPVPSQ